MEYMERLQVTFDNRADLVAHVAAIAPWSMPCGASPFEGGAAAATARLDALQPLRYQRTRNHLDGAVSRLSPYIRHGIVSLDEVREHALNRVGNPDRIEKFIQELAWRDYWQRVYAAHPDWMWNNIEEYKTGWRDEDYAVQLPTDIAQGQTDVACINAFIDTLKTTGYLHNHARMYLAAYIVHWRRVRWQAGARWMMSWLLDGDVASNNLSWQWVASTFSRRPYIFNLENVRKYTGDDIDTRSESNVPLDASYDELASTLFPRKETRR